jgi:hypothetical protein
MKKVGRTLLGMLVQQMAQLIGGLNPIDSESQLN